MKLNSITKMTAALALGLGLTVSAHAEDVIKVGVLHSLSGTMAISETTLKDTVQEALQQIERKQYAAQLVSRGIPKEHIRNYGFAFQGKNVLIG